MKKPPVIIAFLYLAIVVYLMLFGFGRTVGHSYAYNFIPGETIHLFLADARPQVILTQLVGNIVFFMPFGFLFPLCCRGWLKPFALFLLVDIALELLQLFTRRGSFDVDDIILNTSAYLLAFLIYRLWRHFRNTGAE
jgi:glycopeptide antibiotics resistance protein